MGSEPADAELIGLIEEEYARLVGAVAVACGSTSVAEDAVQDALARAWERIARGRRPERLGGWVVVVAMNLTRQRWRRTQSEARALERLVSVADRKQPDLDVSLDLSAAVAALPGRQRQVVVLHYLMGFSVADTAQTLKVSEGTVKSGLSRARTALAQHLGDSQPERKPT